MSFLKRNEKLKAIRLRRKGLSYYEIMEKVSVSVSSLSLWLRDIPLSDEHKKRLIQKQLIQHEKAWHAIRERRIKRIHQLKVRSANEIGRVSKRELWLIGIALYWAEGSKQKEHNIAEQVSISNSDPKLIKLFCRWCKEILSLDEANLIYSLYIHENFREQQDRIRKFWAHTIDVIPECINIYYKKHKVNPYRKNQGDKYLGVLRIRVRRSSELNRRIAGWIDGVAK